MHNFQNELQMLGMDQYHAGELIPMDPMSQQLGEDIRRCGRCGIWLWRVPLWRDSVVEDSAVVAASAVADVALACGGSRFGCVGFGFGCFGLGIGFI